MYTVREQIFYMEIAIMTTGLVFTGLGLMSGNENATSFGLILILSSILAAIIIGIVEHFIYKKKLKEIQKSQKDFVNQITVDLSKISEEKPKKKVAKATKK